MSTNGGIDLADAVNQLEQLAQAEFGKSLDEIIDRDVPWPGGPYDYLKAPYADDAFWRVGRLTGIAAMMPFASCEPIEERPDVVSQTDAKRLWELNSSDGLDPSRREHRMIPRLPDDRGRFRGLRLDVQARKRDLRT